MAKKGMKEKVILAEVFYKGKNVADWVREKE